MNPFLFREYDIRGNAEQDLTDDFAKDCGAALGTYFQRWHDKPKQVSIAIGRDCRLHSQRIHDALVEGLLRTGIHLVDIGVVPTPLLYFSVFHLSLDGGIQITGSHNPPGDNGFKIVHGTQSLHGKKLHLIRSMIEQKDVMVAKDQGTVQQAALEQAYLSFIQSKLLMGKRRFKVVVDAGNGTGGFLLVSLLRSLGFDVIPLFCEMDGRFPNHHPDPTVEKNMQALRSQVLLEGAELGLALDGDADRLGAVDSTGRIVWGDQLLLLLAQAVLQEVPGATILAEVKCSQVVYDGIKEAGGNAIMWKVGHSLLKEKMKEVGAALAGEMSGHLFFSHRYLGYDDAIYAGARLVEFLSKSDRLFSSYVEAIPTRYSTQEIRKEVSEHHKFDLVHRITERFKQMKGLTVIDIDGARIEFPDGWALVRASNTQSAIGMRFEANTPQRLQDIQSFVLSEVAKAEAEFA